jgi:flagellar assembly protein FliH
MTSSKPPQRNVPPPAGGKPASVYARFIPREELSSFSAWNPGALSGEIPPGLDRRRGVTAPEAAPPPAPDGKALLHAARQQGYQDGYRDGLVALEGFKQSFAAQTTSQVGTLLASVNSQLDALQQQMAQALARSATSLALQVVRSELTVRPALVAEVAAEALDTLLLSARHIVIRVHPDDHALVTTGAGDDMAARGARLVADADISRGGCVVESDLGVIDASIETRWQRAAALLGSEQPFAAVAAEATELESDT